MDIPNMPLRLVESAEDPSVVDAGGLALSGEDVDAINEMPALMRDIAAHVLDHNYKERQSFEEWGSRLCELAQNARQLVGEE